MQILDIVMFVPGLPMNEDTLIKGSLGGSETAGLCMAKALAAIGHRVTLFCNTEIASRGKDDVMYMPLAAYDGYTVGVPHDVHIAQRLPEVFARKRASRLNVLWCHDLASGAMTEKFMGTMWNIDTIFVLSDFMRKQYIQVYGDTINPVLVQTRNALDATAFNKVQPSKGANKRVFFSARPERGLDNMLELVMPELWKRDPDWVLAIAGYDNPVGHLQGYYAHVAKLVSAAGKRVEWLGALSKRRLYEEMSRASVYAYPTPSRINAKFEEVYCISAIEAQACGLPVVASARGALNEVVTNGRLLQNGDPWTQEFASAMADAIIDCHGINADDRQVLAGKHRGNTWSNVADEWTDLFVSKLNKLALEPERVFRHFWRQSDIVTADTLVQDVSTSARELIKPWAFMHEPDGYRKQYERIGAGHETYVFETARTEQRYLALRDWLRANKDIKTVLDYGCAHGAYAIGLAEETGVEIVGVDIDLHSVKMAREWAAKSKAADKLKFVVCTKLEDLRAVLEKEALPLKYDCIVAQEVLEHVPEPWHTIDVLASLGKHTYITVPFGPWEYASYHNYPWRCHIWHFDQHDLRDMFGKKKGYTVQGMPNAGSIIGDAIGWWVVRFENDTAPCGKIDLLRKRYLQAPRQTVSVNIIAGPGVELTLGWCLSSLVDIADEIVIGDSGMSDIAKTIAAQYGTRLITVEDPKRVGFENARNAVLAASTMDWVLWIDTDERLVDADNLHKYLRNNAMNGYGVRQHHFSVDANIPPDTPVRLFRRALGLRFFGAIHEHPELKLNEGPGTVLMLSDVSIAHVGYVSESVRRSRFGRNLPLLDLDVARYPDRLLQKHFLIRDHVQSARMMLARTGGRLLPEIITHLENAIGLYKKHFLGKPMYSSADSLQYVTEALAMLGRGVEVSSTVHVGGQDIRLSSLPLVRYETQEDYMIDLGERIKRRWSTVTAQYAA